MRKIVPIILLCWVLLWGCTSKTDAPEALAVTLKPDPQIFGVVKKNDIMIKRSIYAFTVDRGQNIYLIDKTTRLLKLDKTGRLAWEYEKEGQGPGEFQRITDLCIAGDKLLVCEQNRQKILIFTLDGKYVDEFRTVASNPIWIAVDSKGILYIQHSIQSQNMLLQKYTLQGKHLGGIIEKKYNEKNGFLERALNGFSFCIDGDDHIVLVYRYDYAVYKYRSDGTEITKWTRELPFVPVKAHMVQPAPNRMRIEGDTVVQDIAVDGQGRVYALWGCKGDDRGMQVDLFSPRGDLLTNFHTGTWSGRNSQAVCMDRDGHFYVANRFGEPDIYKYALTFGPRDEGSGPGD